MKGQSPEVVLHRPISLSDAQLVLAREYGFRDWGDLKRQVETAARAPLVPERQFNPALNPVVG